MAGRGTLLRVLAGRIYAPILAALPEARVGQLQLALLRRTAAPELVAALEAGGFAYAAAAEAYRQVAGQDYLAVARQVRLPALVLNGSRDRTNRHDAAAFLAALDNSSELII